MTEILQTLDWKPWQKLKKAISTSQCCLQ